MSEKTVAEAKRAFWKANHDLARTTEAYLRAVVAESSRAATPTTDAGAKGEGEPSGEAPPLDDLIRWYNAGALRNGIADSHGLVHLAGNVIEWVKRRPSQPVQPQEQPAASGPGKPSEEELQRIEESGYAKGGRNGRRALFEAGAASRDAEVAAYERFVEQCAHTWLGTGDQFVKQHMMQLRRELAALEAKGGGKA